ncbi:MAG: D-sedoheptulose 7-phosphate isomerase [Marinifilaceae bacterium]
MGIVTESLNDSLSVLKEFISDKKNIDNIEEVAEIMIKAIKSGNMIISCGNGGSLCDASHFAEELTGRFRDDRISLPAVAINDASHITCVANDFGFEYVFSKFVEGVGREGDVLLVLSTSGNSENIIKAVEEAKRKNITVVALTGKDGGKLSSIVDKEIRVEWFKYSDRIQEIHIKVLHILVQLIEEGMF